MGNEETRTCFEKYDMEIVGVIVCIGTGSEIKKCVDEDEKTPTAHLAIPIICVSVFHQKLRVPGLQP
jgi:hypothetical protein